MRRIALGAVLWLALVSGAAAHLAKSDLKDVAIAPNEGASIPVDTGFANISGGQTTIGKVLDGRPGLLVFADYTCHTLCGTTIAMASDALAKAHLEPGKDFHFIVVGIDPKDSVSDAKAMRTKYLKDGLVGPETAFLLGDRKAVDVATHAAGYSYAYDAEADQFAHPTGAFVLAPDGRISRVLTAIGLKGETVRLALVEAGNGKIGGFADHVRLLCYGFDPATGTYNGVVLNWLRGLGFATVGAVGLLVAFLGIRKRGRNARNGGTAR